jgi:hypothetical protein
VAAAQAAAAIGCEAAQIVKSLVFRARPGDALRVLTSGRNRVDTATVASLVAEPIGKADATSVREVTGFAIGSVPPARASADRVPAGGFRLWRPTSRSMTSCPQLKRADVRPAYGPSSSTALGRVVSKSMSFAQVGVTTIRTMPSYNEPTSASHSTRCSGVIW